MHDSLKDCLLALILFSVGVVGFLYIQLGPGEALQNSRDAQITFRSFPSVISGLLMLLTAVYAIASITAWIKFRKVGGDKIDNGTVTPAPSYLSARIIGLLVLLIAFALSIGLLPLFVLASIFLFIAFFIFGQKQPLRMGAVAIIGGGLFHGLFVMVLDLPLS